MPSKRSPRNPSDRGAVAVLAALLMLIMGAFMALTLNIGLAMSTRAALQNGSDSAALGGAGALDGTAAGLTAARLAAVNYAAAHQVQKDSIVINSLSDVRLGRWDFPTRTFIDLGTNPNPVQVTAVRVLDGRNGGTHNAPLGVYFSVFLGGQTTMSVSSSAVAIGNGPGTVKCALPFAIAECSLPKPCVEGAKTLTFSNAPSDNIAFVNLTGGNNAPGPPEVISEINGGCPGYTVSNQDFQVSNGNSLNDNVITALLSPADGTGCYIGREAAFAVLDGFTCSPSGSPNFNNGVTATLVGFIKVTITQVTDNKGDSLACDGSKTKTSQKGRSVTATISCLNPTGSSGGGHNFGGPEPKLRIVQ